MIKVICLPIVANREGPHPLHSGFGKQAVHLAGGSPGRSITGSVQGWDLKFNRRPGLEGFILAPVRVKLVQTVVVTDTQLWAAIAVTLMAPRIRSCSSHHALNRQALCQQLWGTFQAADAAAPKSRPGPDLQYRRARLRFR